MAKIQGSAVQRALGDIAEDLHRVEARFALVGGLAVSARAQPRFTRDADLAVAAPSDQEAEALIFSLRTSRYRVAASVEQNDRTRLSTVRLEHVDADVFVDLLFASSGIEPEVVERAEVLEVLPDLFMPVARIPELVAMKVLSREPRRPQDDGDIQALLAFAADADHETIKANLELIKKRGYARGKNLQRDWNALRKRFALP